MHQSLGYTTPDVVYQTGTGGGAMIVDKFNELTETGVIELVERQRKFMLKRAAFIESTTGGLHVDKA